MGAEADFPEPPSLDHDFWVIQAELQRIVQSELNNYQKLNKMVRLKQPNIGVQTGNMGREKYIAKSIKPLTKDR